MNHTMRRRVAGLEASSSAAARMIVVTVPLGDHSEEILRRFGVTPHSRDLLVTISKPDPSPSRVCLDGQELTPEHEGASG